MSLKPEVIGKKLLDTAIDGAGIYAGDKVQEYLRLRFYDTVEKNLKQYSKPAILVGLSLLDSIIPPKILEGIPFIGDWLQLWGRAGVADLIKTLVDKPPYCLVEDANTIHCFNFTDTTSVKVAIDGVEVSGFTVSGTPSEFNIMLPSPMASGERHIRVSDSKVAWYGKARV